MKQMISVILFYQCLVLTVSGQQNIYPLRNDSAKMYVSYNFYSEYLNDSVYNKLIPSSLFLGNKGSVYTFQYQTVNEFIGKFEKSIKDNKYKNFILEELKKTKDLEFSLTTIYAKHYEEPGYLKLIKFEDDFFWIADTMKFDWRLSDEFKIIEGFKCQKAKGESKGNTIIAWFTEEIPINSGPYYVSGLPGLILEYYNPETKVCFKATSITSTNIPDQKFRNWLSGRLVNKKEHERLEAENKKNIENLQRMIQRGRINQDN